MAQDGRSSEMHTRRVESTLDGQSSFDHAVIMFVQAQFRELCSMRAPLHGCTVLLWAGGLTNLWDFGGK